MRISWVMLVCTACASAGGGVATSHVPTPAVPHANISGLWQYDADSSTSPGVEAMVGGQGARADSGSRGGRRGGMGGRGFGGMGGGFRGRGEGEGGERGGGEMPPSGMSEKARQRMRETMRLAMDAGPVLSISQTDSTVLLVRPQRGDTTLLHANGLPIKDQPPQGMDGAGAIETSSVWESGEFFVTRAVDGGGKITEIYYRQPDDPHLYVVVRVQGGPIRRKIEFRRVYDPVTTPGS
jgi:hypothetical protein